MSPPFDYPTTVLDRGKVLTTEEVEKMIHFARYEDKDGDGVAPRTPPGSEHPRAAYFTRGGGHDAQAHLSEWPEDWEANDASLERQRQTAYQYLSEPFISGHNTGRVGLVGFDSTDLAIIEAVDCLAGSNVRISYLSLPALPFVEIAQEFIEAHERIYIVELNSRGQLYQLLRRDYPDLANRLISLCHNSDLPLTASWIAENIIECEGEYL